jgi:(1->4)-alpha-D-glucan 1-alpha-D-glucosylmutase
MGCALVAGATLMPPEIPLGTYRLQLTREFGFDDAAKLAPYLKALGISHIYASPFLKARAGSTHGYDIVDHAALNPELGGEEGFLRLSRALADADLGLILDFVPNHMGVGKADNAWWLDVLEWGQKSPHARSFDIDWQTLPYKPEGGVLIPILGKLYGDALEAGEIQLCFDQAEGSFSAWYFEHRLPIRPNRYGDILRTVVGAAGATGDPAGKKLLDVAALYPDPRAPSREQAPAFKAALANISGGAAIIERGLSAYQPQQDDPVPTLALHRLLERQHYRLAHWRVAVSEINYRRFFDINDLAGLRVEDMRTFTAMHHLVGRMIADGQLHGLRLDHIDGLHDPSQYTERLQRLVRRVRPRQRRHRPFYLLVEKILGEDEENPQLPGVMGTTGYEWTNVISRVLIDPMGMPALQATAERMTNSTKPFSQVVQEAKHRVLETMLASEFTVLVRLLTRIAAGQWRTRDFTSDRLRTALELYVLHLPVYRTYVTADSTSETDRETISQAIEAARAQWFGPDAEIFTLLKDALTLDLISSDRRGHSSARVRYFALKVQQFTGPMMAKSVEDTAFYRYVPILALNEVGGHPTLPALSIAEFHEQMQRRCKTSPHGLTTTATHDTKRSEDARARLLALSEIAVDWSEEVARWAAHNAGWVRQEGRRMPSLTHEYLLYQTLLGVWQGTPDNAFIVRIEAYAIKAAREGKIETSWMNPDEGYEAALSAFVRHILNPVGDRKFVDMVSKFAQRVTLLGAANSLLQLALKATMPGVPDFYQGTEFWDFSLVDPDNRRPVDFAAREAALAKLGEEPDWAELVRGWADGRLKLALTREFLHLRRSMPDVFTVGGYRPLPIHGKDADHVIAFARNSGREAAIVVAGRHFARCLGGGDRWPSTRTWDATIGLNDFEGIENVLRRGLVHAEQFVPFADLAADLPLAVLRGKVRTPLTS